MKNINRERFLISFMIIAAISVFTYIMSRGYHQGVFGNGWFAHLIIHICNLWYFIFVFPNIILYMLGILQNWIGFALGVTTGALFYSLLLEFILIRRSSKNKSESNIRIPKSNFIVIKKLF